MRAVVPTPGALPPAPVDMEERVGARVVIWWPRAVASVLELARVISPALPLVAVPVDGCKVLPPDWSI
jgi:hypothetical protein